MNVITKNFKVYDYTELSEEVKQKVREKLTEEIGETFRYNYDFVELVKSDLKGIGLENLRPYYSLSYCQGDGLCLTGYIDFDEIRPELKKVFCKDFTLADCKIYDMISKYSRIEFNHVGNYYHCNSVSIDIENDIDINNCSMDEFNNHQIVINKLEYNVKNWHDNISYKYEKLGYSYFYDITEDEIIEYCSELGIQFLENGTIFE